MSATITCEWCAEEIPADSQHCPKCQGSVRRTPQVASVAPLAPPKPTPPAGWYDDPKMVNTRRYWDGAAWTDQRIEKAAGPATAPTPPVAPAVRDEPAYAWVIALLPITAVPIIILEPGITDSWWFWVGYWALTLFLGVLDGRQLRRRGVKGLSYFGTLLLVPAYLIDRTRVAGSTVVIPIVWFATFAAVILSIVLAPAHYDYDQKTIEKDIASQYSDQLDDKIAVDCPEAKNVKAGDSIHCTAVDSDGNEVLVKVEFNDDDGGSYTFKAE